MDILEVPSLQIASVLQSGLLCGVGISEHSSTVLNKCTGVLVFPFVACCWWERTFATALPLSVPLGFTVTLIKLTLPSVVPALRGWALLVNIIFTDVVLSCQH